MKKLLSMAISVICMALIYTGCSQSQMAGFQQNDQEPEYNLLGLFDAFPALHSAVESIDSQKLNDGLGDMMINGYETPEFLRDAVQLVQAPFLVPMINELHGLLTIMMDTSQTYHYVDSEDGGYYSSSSIDRLARFYDALETVVDRTDLSADILDMATQVVDYLVDTKTPQEIEEDMGNMMKVRLYDNCMYDETDPALYVDLPVGSYDSTALGSHSGIISSLSIPIGVKVTLYDGTDLTGNSLELTSGDRCLTDNLVGAGPANWNDQVQSVKIEYDMTKLAKLAGKVTMSCDYPMWLDPSSGDALRTNRDDINASADTNTDLGNAVKGVIKLLYGLNTIAATDETVRNTIDAMILEDLPGLLNSDPEATTKIENLIVNMSNYFAVDEIGTSLYESSTDYHNTSLTTGYVNASFKETLRDMLPTLGKLFIRNDGSSSEDYSIIKTSNQSPIEALTVSLNKLRAAGIDFSDSANALEPTLKRTMQYNGRMQSRTDDAAWSQMSYLDHLVYTIGSAYYFGYLTRPGSASGEGGYTNFGYGHGETNNGIITINDSMFALTSMDSLVVILDDMGLPAWLITILEGIVSGLGIPGMDSYELALSKRVDQGDHIGRSSLGAFAASAIGSHKFYLGYDYPTMQLLPSNCAGDAGIPNGGETAITVNSDTTDSTTGGTNDYRTYWPRVADGKGVLNTSQFLMGWVARVAWDGQGPYYSTTYTNDATHPATTTYVMPVNGSQTVNVYYKPNGEVYAYVYKPTTDPSDWEYFYPNSLQSGIGDDIPEEATVDPYQQRANRYKDVVVSDYYMIKHGSNYNLPPMNESGSSNVEGTSGDNKYKLTDATSTSTPAKYFKLYERIGEKQKTTEGASIRECATQEEAIFRNIQWFLFEKKMVFIIPMFINLLELDSSGAFILIEANGAVGLANAKKGTANGRWVKLGSEGIPATTYNPNYANAVDYGDSNRPGDGRISVFCHEVDLLGFGLIIINPNFLFDGVLGNGYVLPDAVGRNIEPVSRMAFLTSTDVPVTGVVDANNINSDDRTETWTTAWTYRNKLAPVLAALAGTLHDGTKYETSSSGYNYNYASPSPHKYPLADMLEGVLMPLGKPMFRRFNTADTGSTPRWVPRVKSETGATFAYLRPNASGFGYTPTINNYIPRDTLRTPLSVLVGNSIDSYDGVMPMMADGGGMVTRLLGLLQLLGSDEYAEPRANIGLGLEQVMTAAKFNKSEAITNGYFTTLDFSRYEWMFNKRAEDLDLEDLLGYEGEYRTTADGGDWETFEDMVDMMKSFMGGDRDISQNLVNVLNAVLAQQLSEDEVHGLLYTAGKLFAKHNQVYPGGVWQYHGYDHGPGNTDSYDQLVDMLAYLPQVHDVMKSEDGSGVKYNRLLQNVDILMKDQNSLVHTLLEGMSTPYTAQDVIEDLDRFLGWSIISDPNSPLWDDLVLMLDAMADMNDPRIDINTIIKNLGFQAN